MFTGDSHGQPLAFCRNADLHPRLRSSLCPSVELSQGRGPPRLVYCLSAWRNLSYIEEHSTCRLTFFKVPNAELDPYRTTLNRKVETTALNEHRSRSPKPFAFWRVQDCSPIILQQSCLNHMLASLARYIETPENMDCSEENGIHWLRPNVTGSFFMAKVLMSTHLLDHFV
jgi:hypothetical protein